MVLFHDTSSLSVLSLAAIGFGTSIIARVRIFPDTRYLFYVSHLGVGYTPYCYLANVQGEVISSFTDPHATTLSLSLPTYETPLLLVIAPAELKRIAEHDTRVQNGSTKILPNAKD